LLNDFEARLRISILTANEPFLFYTGVGKECDTGNMAWSLKGFAKTLETIDIKAVEFHLDNGDFESWARCSLKDQKLASKFGSIRSSKEKSEELRNAMVDATKKRYAELRKQTMEATQLF
jgi:hypothetical protein